MNSRDMRSSSVATLLLTTLFGVCCSTKGALPPVTYFYLRPGMAWTTPQPIDAQKWRNTNCRDGMNEACFNLLAFSAAANQKTEENHDLGLRMVIGASNEYFRQKYVTGSNALKAEEIDAIKLQINAVVNKYKDARDHALGDGNKWDDDASVKAAWQATQAVGTGLATLFAGPGGAAGASFGFAFNKVLLDQLDQFRQPWIQLRAQENYYAAGIQAHSLGDVYGDLRVLSNLLPGVGDAVDPALYTYLGITTKTKGSEIVDKDPTLKTLFLTEDNRELLKLIYNAVKNGQKITAENLEEIRKQLVKQEGKTQDTDPEKAAKKLADYEASLQIFSSLGAFVDDPDLKKAISNTTIVGKAVLTLYHCQLNPEKLSKLVLTANVVQAVATVFELFMGAGGSELQALSEQIADLQKSVQDLHETVLKGFELTNQKLDVIYNTMVDGLKQIHDGQALELAKLDKLGEALSEVDQKTGRMEISLGEYFTASSQRLADSLTARALYGDRWFSRDKLTSIEFKNCAAPVLLESTRFPNDFVATKFSEADFTTLKQTPLKLVTENYNGSFDYRLASASNVLNSRNPIEVMNYLGVCYLEHLGINTFPTSNGKLVPVPSLPQWLLGVATFSELLTNHKAYVDVIDDQAIKDVLENGSRIQSFVRNVRTERWLNAALSNVATKQAALFRSLEDLQDKYLKSEDLSEFSTSFWDVLPTATKISIPLPKVIPQEIFGTKKDLSLRLPEKALPEFARVAVALKSGEVTPSWQLVGAKSPKGNIWSHVQDGQVEYDTTDQAPGGGLYETKRVRLLADLEVQTRFRINDYVIAEWNNRNSTPLWIGNRTYTQDFQITSMFARKPIGRPKEIARAERTNADVLEQVWDDGNYRLRDHVTGGFVTGQPRRHFEFGRFPTLLEGVIDSQIEITKLNEQQWLTKQTKLKQLMVGAMTGGTSVILTDEVRKVHTAVKELDSMYALLEASMPIAFSSRLRDDNKIADLFYSERGVLTSSMMSDWISAIPYPQKRPLITQLRDLASVKHNALTSGLKDELTMLQNKKETIPELDAAVAQLATLKKSPSSSAHPNSTRPPTRHR